MNKLLFIIFLFPICLNAQIYDHHRVFNDTLNYKDFNQGFIDSQVYFKGTGDYLIGLTSIYIYYVPTAICFSIPPNDKRLINSLNPNNEYLYSNNKLQANMHTRNCLFQLHTVLKALPMRLRNFPPKKV